jgi:hypothetical protein
VDLSKIDVPTYISFHRSRITSYPGSRHFTLRIWSAERRGLSSLRADTARVITPPTRNKRSHWLNDDLESDPEAWFDAAESRTISAPEHRVTLNTPQWRPRPVVTSNTSQTSRECKSGTVRILSGYAITCFGGHRPAGFNGFLFEAIDLNRL